MYIYLTAVVAVLAAYSPKCGPSKRQLTKGQIKAVSTAF